MAWDRGDADPTYSIVDDQPSHECYVYAELYGDDPFNPGWPAGFVEALRDYPDWGVGIGNIPDSYVLIFRAKLLVKGRDFRACPDAVTWSRRSGDNYLAGRRSGGSSGGDPRASSRTVEHELRNRWKTIHARKLELYVKPLS
jgi:hypothetical protein